MSDSRSIYSISKYKLGEASTGHPYTLYKAHFSPRTIPVCLEAEPPILLHDSWVSNCCRREPESQHEANFGSTRATRANRLEFAQQNKLLSTCAPRVQPPTISIINNFQLFRRHSFIRWQALPQRLFFLFFLCEEENVIFFF